MLADLLDLSLRLGQAFGIDVHSLLTDDEYRLLHDNPESGGTITFGLVLSRIKFVLAHAEVVA